MYLKDKANELMIDDRANGGELLFFKTLTCCHCQVQVILRPERVRERHHCRKCHAYVCDNENCITNCNGSFKKIINDAQETAARLNF